MVEYSEQITKEQLKRTRMPVEVYRFWNRYREERIVNFDEEIIFEGKKYTPAVVNRTGGNRTADQTVSTLRIDVDYLNPNIVEYLGSAPLGTTYVQVTKVFRGQRKKEGIVYFIGVLGRLNLQGVKASVECYGIERLLRVTCPKWRYTPLCVHKVYGEDCGLNKNDFVVVVNPTANSTNTQFTSATFGTYALNYFNLGFIEHVNSPPVMIVSHSGSVITTRFPVINFMTGQEIRVYPGCNKTIENCVNFDNHRNVELDRFLGFPHIPMDNPTTWNSV